MIALKKSFSGLLLSIALATAAFATPQTWVTAEKDKDLLTGQQYVFVRLASGAAAKNRRYVDVVKKADGYVMRFVVPEPTNAQTTVWAPGVASTRTARELGETLSWMVEGKSQHDEAPSFSKRKRRMGITDHEAAWRIGCEELRELVTGQTLRIVTPEFNGEFDLAALPPQLEKAFGLTRTSLVKGSASICGTPAPSAEPAGSPTPSPTPRPNLRR